MSKVKMEIESDPAQIDALRVYLGRKDTYLEFEISRFIESLYIKTVPNVVRDYISANNENKKNERRSEAI